MEGVRDQTEEVPGGLFLPDDVESGLSLAWLADLLMQGVRGVRGFFSR